MKYFLFPSIILCLLFTQLTYGQKFKQVIVSDDIETFWKAYDRICSVKDTTEQYNLLKDIYLDKGTPGLKALLQVRRYSEKEFIDAITTYPKFWNSIRPNTLKVKRLYPKIKANIRKLSKAYPELKPATIYFAVGAFRTGGTILGDKVLIGSELSLADHNTVTDELPDWRKPFYQTQNPYQELPLLCTHEYVHTQQKELVENLLSMCLYEGVAEFISCKVTVTKSSTPAIEFGKANEKKAIDQFVSDLFITSNNYNWLWGENKNTLKIRDLGYYIGYEICERYYNLSGDKRKAIKDLIELDYTNEKEVERIVDLTRLLPKTLQELHKDYENRRPTVVKLLPFENGSRSVKPGLTKITVQFSEPLDKRRTGIDFGPLGKDLCPDLKPQRLFNEEGTSWMFEADLKPNRHYQLLISDNFRTIKGIRLKPFLIDFTTSEK